MIIMILIISIMILLIIIIMDPGAVALETAGFGHAAKMDESTKRRAASEAGELRSGGEAGARASSNREDVHLPGLALAEHGMFSSS